MFGSRRGKKYDDRVERDADCALHELAHVNSCMFISDLRWMYQRGHVVLGGISTYHYDLDVWNKVLTYLSGEPMSFEDYEEVEAAFDVYK